MFRRIAVLIFVFNFALRKRKVMEGCPGTNESRRHTLESVRWGRKYLSPNQHQFCHFEKGADVQMLTCTV